MQAYCSAKTLSNLLLFATILVVFAEAQVVWSNYPDIQSGNVFFIQLRSQSTQEEV